MTVDALRASIAGLSEHVHVLTARIEINGGIETRILGVFDATYKAIEARNSAHILHKDKSVTYKITIAELNAIADWGTA